MSIKKRVGIWLGAVSCLAMSTGCGFSKKEGGDPLAGPGAPRSLASLQLTPDDWVVESGARGKAQVVTRSVKAEKMDFIRRNFQVPRLTPVSAPESNGFELYDVHGYAELETATYIHPKIYLNTGNGQGQVLGYRTGKKDPAGNELIEISVPVALVNGLVSSVPTLGGTQEGAGAAVLLPSKYQIQDLVGIKSRLAPGKTLLTLPVCPKLFRLAFQGREYWAKSPFENLSTCPINQFFRISFQAPVAEMQKLLETAAVRDEAVSLITSLSVAFDMPRLAVDASFTPDDFYQALQASLNGVPEAARDQAGAVGYETQDIETAVTDTLFRLAREAGLDPRYSASLLASINPLIAREFGPPYACAAGGACRALLKKPFQRTPVTFSWTVAEELAASLETETVTALGAVANSSRFVSKPSLDVLSVVRRPSYFRARSIAEVIQECTQLAGTDFASIPEATPEGIAYFKSYCAEMVANGRRDGDESNSARSEDGYYPLGANTVVYPGAWVKIDLDDISEFTTAKTKTLPDGTMRIESEVVDLLASDPTAKRTQCLDGNAIACTTYRTKQVAVRAANGDPMFSSGPCQKGEGGCDCVRKPDSNGAPGEEVCTKRQYQFQDVMDYACDAPDEFEYCPYWREEDEIIDYEKEWDCQTVTVEDRSTFLCMGGCSKHSEIQCNLKSKKPVMAKRQKLNCQEDDPRGTAAREHACRVPKYKCKQWATACTKYTVNEVFQVIHEDVAAKWRPFAIQKGEYPARFEEDITFKFVSPGRTVSGCHLNRFAREFRGNSIYLKMPSEKNEGLQPCDEPLWDERNTQALYLPKIYIKNAISYAERRLCGRTQYSFTTKEVPMTSKSDGDGLVPPEFSYKTETQIGPVREACRAEVPFQIGSDLWFTEYPPIRFSGRVSVLGRVLESIVTEARP